MAKYSKPLVLEFDHSVVKKIFQDARNAIIIFNGGSSNKLKKIAEKVAEKYQGSTVIAEIMVLVG